jgi:hypothetical protein
MWGQAAQEGRNFMKSEIDGVSHGLITSIVGMQMIFRGELRQQSAGVLWVAQNRVEVDYPSNE